MGWNSAGTSWAISRERSADATASTAFIAKTASQAVATNNHHSPERGDWARCRARARDELGDKLVTGRRRCRASQIASHVASSQRWLGENEPGATSTAWKSQNNLSPTASQSQSNLFDLKPRMLLDAARPHLLLADTRRRHRRRSKGCALRSVGGRS